MSHHQSCTVPIESDRRFPQLGVGGWMPKPRNDSVLSTRIASATTSVAFTMIGPMQFGSTWRTMMRVFDAPIARAASTNSRSRRASVAPRTTPRDRPPEQQRQQQRDPQWTPEVDGAEGSEVDGADRDRHREEGQRRQRDPEVGEAHQETVDPAAVEARERADHHSDERRQQRHAERDLQRDLAAVEHPRERVAAELVGAEPVRSPTGPTSVAPAPGSSGRARSAHPRNRPGT